MSLFPVPMVQIWASLPVPSQCSQSTQVPADVRIGIGHQDDAGQGQHLGGWHPQYKSVSPVRCLWPPSTASVSPPAAGVRQSLGGWSFSCPCWDRELGWTGGTGRDWKGLESFWAATGGHGGSLGGDWD